MKELEIFVFGLFKIFFFIASLWTSYRIGKISGIEEAKRIWMRYSDGNFDEDEED